MMVPGQKICVDNPDVCLPAAKLLSDGGECRRNDGTLEGDEQTHNTESHNNGPVPPGLYIAVDWRGFCF